MSSMPSTRAASEIVSGLSGFDCATDAGVCTLLPIELSGTPGASNNAVTPVGICHLSGRDERELVEEALGVLDDADDLALDATDAPAVADREVEVRGEAARDRDLARARRVAPGDEREHRTAEGPVRVLRTELIGVDRSRDRLRLVLDHLDAAEAVLQARDDARRVRVVAREGHGVLRRAEAGVLRRRVVRRDGRADDRRRDRDRDEGEDQELLTPLPPEEPPGPADDGTTGGRAAVGRAGVGDRCEHGGAHRDSFRVSCAGHPVTGVRSDERVGSVGCDVVDDVAVAEEHDPVGPRREVRVVGDDDRGDPRSAQASRIIAITASPFVESSAPDGSSARRRWRSPTTARAIATRWRSPPESWSG